MLNSEYFIRRWVGKFGLQSWNSTRLDPVAVEVLNEIIRRTGAKVVVSSTWRIGRTASQLQELLEKSGFKGAIYGTTPRLYGKIRGEEIEVWVRAQVEAPESFIILDDDSDMGALTGRLIQTSGERGLTVEHVARAVMLLEKPFKITW